MSFPEPQIKEKTDFINYNTDFYNINEMLEELTVPKQTFQQEEQTPPPPIDTPEAEPVPVDPQKAARMGERTAKMIDAALATVNGTLIAKAPEIDKYKASEGELRDLSGAWAEVSEIYDFNVSPWLKLAVLNLSIYTPKTVLAFQDRRFNEMNKRIDEMQRQQTEMSKTIENLKKEETILKARAEDGN